MIDDVRLRSATDADYEFGYLVKKAALGPYIAETWGWKEDEQRDFYRGEFSLADAYVIMLGDTDVGWLVNRRTPEGQELHQLYILPEHQNRGIGSKLVREIRFIRMKRMLMIRWDEYRCLFSVTGHLESSKNW